MLKAGRLFSPRGGLKVKLLSHPKPSLYAMSCLRTGSGAGLRGIGIHTVRRRRWSVSGPLVSEFVPRIMGHQMQWACSGPKGPFSTSGQC